MREPCRKPGEVIDSHRVLTLLKTIIL